jgi:hypothetical protein
MKPTTDKIVSVEEYEKQLQAVDKAIKTAKADYIESTKKMRDQRRKIKQLQSRAMKAETEKLCQELGERVVKVLGRPPVREDLDRLEKFLLGQETYGNHFTKAMSGKPQESELSTLSTLKNGLRAL